MHLSDRTRHASAFAAFVAFGVCATTQAPAGDSRSRVGGSTDVAWLERVAMSAQFADEAQSERERVRFGSPKDLRVAAYARLGALGSSESLAALDRIERQMAAAPLTPATVPLDWWPSVAWHMADRDLTNDPRAVASPQNGVTYAVVFGELLGGQDLFLVTTRTPGNRSSWSRPKLIGPAPAGVTEVTGTLVWRGPRTLMLTVERHDVRIALDEVERDSDGDGWTDVEEARIGTNPHSTDSDDDGIPDGRDVCPLYAKPTGADEASQILQAAVFGAFAMTGSRQLLYVTPQTPRVHLSGYGGPVVYDRPLPKSGDGGGAAFVSWKITSRTGNDAIVELTDWEGVLAGGGQEVTVKRTAGRWVVVAVRSTWVS